MTYGHLQADCLYTGISSGPNARCRVWEAFTFYLTIMNKSVTVLVAYFMTYVYAPISTIVSGVLQPPVISLQRSVTIIIRPTL